MSSIIINIVLAFLVIVPVIYLTIRKKKATNTAFSEYLQKLKSQSIKVDKQTSFSDACFALSNEKKILYYLSYEGKEGQVHLDQVVGCTTLRQANSNIGNAVGAIGFQITEKGGANHSIPLLGNQNDKIVDETQLLDVLEWEKIIKKYINKL